MADLGYAAIIAAFVIAIYAAVAAFVGARARINELWLSTRNAVFVVFGLVSIASAALVYSFFARDFSIRYVAEHSSSDLPPLYTLAGWWAGQAGSLLFWAWILSIAAAVIVLRSEKRAREQVPYVTAVMMAVLAYFLGIIAFAANPLEKMPLALSEGTGLNPLLRTSDMISHPTSLLLGYSLLTVPFAFAMAALITGRVDDWWIRSTRRWTLTAWVFLTLGNLLGMLWAYRVLGWGGYWGWDPVENASFLPWLTATAYLHSVMIQQRRGMLKVWNMILIIVTFALSLFGTLLTRSGILSSVHSFAMGAVGPLFLVLIVIALGGSLLLLWARLPHLRGEHQLDSLVSREATFMANNLVLVGIAFAVFWGTIFPLLSEAVRDVKVGVGPPFYQQITAPLFLALIVLMGICPLIGWRKASTENLLRNFLYPLAAALVTGVALYLLGLRPMYAVLAFASLAFVGSALLLEFYRGVRARHRGHGDNYLIALPRLVWRNKPRYGGYLVHLGVILLAMGIIGSQMFSTNVEGTIAPGESLQIRDYTLTFQGLNETSGANSSKVTGTLDVARGGNPVGSIQSSKRFEGLREDEPVTDPGIRSTAREDLYVILAGWTDDGKATFKVLVNPLVMWIWVGGTVIVAGTVLAFWPDAREERRVPVRQALPVKGVEASHA
ncbi:MAG TPA: heme lyase CcmF/NrfE family subunit [Dehalococcoidia bacterium]|nr:heme lyase CcmF/NrfE family subunit [Dehalococcoidia bacterium]